MDFYIVLIVAVAVCYGWGMRGCIIGGEKGALLPGALMGLTLTLFTHDETALCFAAVGAIGMFRGGTEPYAQTLDGVRRKYRSKNRFGKSIFGVFMKGGLWFGIAGITLAMMTGANTFYKPWSLLLILLIPFVQAFGVRIFNKPYDRKNGVFPKIYFSETSREEWGGSVLHFLLLCVIAAINGDIFSLIIGLAGLLGGGVGFVAGILSDDFCSNPMKNGRYVFGRFYTDGRIDTWKIMEHSFGFIAGFTVAAAFFIQKNTFISRLAEFTSDTPSTPFSFVGDDLAGIILFALIVLSAVQYPIKNLYRKRTGRKPDDHLSELIERPLYETLPLFLIFCGNRFTMKYFAVFVLMWVLGEEFFCELYERYENRRLIITIGIITSISGLIPVFTGNTALPILPLLTATAAYTALCVLHVMPTATKRSRTNPTLLTHFFIETAVIITACILIY